MLLFTLHKIIPHCDGSIFFFDGCRIKKILPQISSYIKVFYLEKIWRANTSYLLLRCVWVLKRIHVCNKLGKYELINKYYSVNFRIYYTVNWCSTIMTLNVFSNFKFNFNCNEALFYKSKINSHGVYLTKNKTREEGFFQF